MAWIESHQELAWHPKTRRLASLLGVSVPTAIGHLHLLWWWVVAYRPTGQLGRIEPAEVAEAAQWPGDPIQFLGALVQARFVDEEGGEYGIHDWLDYAGRLLEWRRRHGARRKAWREAHVAPDAHVTCAATGPDQTGPDQTGPDRQPFALGSGVPGDEAGAARGPGSAPDPRLAEYESRFTRAFGLLTGSVAQRLAELVAEYPDLTLQYAFEQAERARPRRPLEYLAAVCARLRNGSDSWSPRTSLYRSTREINRAVNLGQITAEEGRRLKAELRRRHR